MSCTLGLKKMNIQVPSTVRPRNLKTQQFVSPVRPAVHNNHYETLIGKLDSLGLEYYLMGDLNCNMASTRLDSNTRLLCELSDIYGLQKLITEPTRITESSSSLIDVIFTNCINRIVCSGVLHVGISDHSLIYALYRKLAPEFAFKRHSTKTYRTFCNFNRENFRRDIS